VEREDETDEEGEDLSPVPGRRQLQAPRLRRRPAVETDGERETLKGLVRELPAFVKLLLRLARDPRVSRLDKGIVLAAVAYVVAPIDVIPDIPFVGQIDDVVLVALAINRLLNNAGVDVLLDHWDGDPATLERALDLLDRVDSYIPAPVRSLLGRRKR
jgi:uncharacterized membrane protein YkvA (DUF1232 family)